MNFQPKPKPVFLASILMTTTTNFDSKSTNHPSSEIDAKKAILDALGTIIHNPVAIDDIRPMRTIHMSSTNKQWTNLPRLSSYVTSTSNPEKSILNESFLSAQACKKAQTDTSFDLLDQFPHLLEEIKSSIDSSKTIWQERQISIDQKRQVVQIQLDLDVVTQKIESLPSFSELDSKIASLLTQIEKQESISQILSKESDKLNSLYKDFHSHYSSVLQAFESSPVSFWAQKSGMPTQPPIIQQVPLIQLFSKDDSMISESTTNPDNISQFFHDHPHLKYAFDSIPDQQNPKSDLSNSENTLQIEEEEEENK